MSTEKTTQFSERVKKRRFELGLSKKAVADKVDVSASYIGLLELPGSAIVRETSVDAPHITDTGVQPCVGKINGREAWVILSYRRVSDRGKGDIDDVIARGV